MDKEKFIEKARNRSTGRCSHYLLKSIKGLRCEHCKMEWSWQNAGPVVYDYICQVERDHFKLLKDDFREYELKKRSV